MLFTVNLCRKEVYYTPNNCTRHCSNSSKQRTYCSARVSSRLTPSIGTCPASSFM